MPRTPEEQKEWELQAYGCLINDFVEDVKKTMDYKESRNGSRMCIFSQLSDAQSLIELGDGVKANQAINRAKHLVDLMSRGEF